MKDKRFFYTGTRATDEQEAAMRRSYSDPYIVVGGYVPVSPPETMHAFALANGLPEIVGWYGYDFAEREFIRMPDADKGEPDRWPSRKLQDILAAFDAREAASN